MKVTIEGVINSDVCARGEQHTVELTDRLKALAANRIIEIVDWHHDEPEEPAVEKAPEPAPRKRRRRAVTE
jgi:hypothetical protein